MRELNRLGAVLLAIATAITACAAPSSPMGGRTQAGENPAPAPASPKRIVAGLTGDPPTFSARFNPGGVVPVGPAVDFDGPHERARSLDYAVGAQHELGRDREADRLGRLEIDR